MPLRDRAGQPLRILVVDDDAAVAAVLQGIVREAGGHVVGTVASGLAAVGAAAVIEPDVVVMDIRLPDMDGIDAAGVIRARRATPVVFATGADVRAEIEARLQSLDRIEVVMKPVDRAALRAAVRRVYLGSSSD